MLYAEKKSLHLHATKNLSCQSLSGFAVTGATNLVFVPGLSSSRWISFAASSGSIFGVQPMYEKSGSLKVSSHSGAFGPLTRSTACWTSFAKAIIGTCSAFVRSEGSPLGISSWKVIQLVADSILSYIGNWNPPLKQTPFRAPQPPVPAEVKLEWEAGKLTSLLAALRDPEPDEEPPFGDGDEVGDVLEPVEELLELPELPRTPLSSILALLRSPGPFRVACF